MEKTIRAKERGFANSRILRIISGFILVFAAILTTASTGLLEVANNYFGFPLVWKIISAGAPIFQALNFAGDTVFWLLLYLSALAGIVTLIRRRLEQRQQRRWVKKD